jgi:hypothetical protein
MKDTDKSHSNDRSKDDPKRKNANPSIRPPNPPRTTTGKLTSPKFGSAGSGGAELEPGPEES